MILSNPDMMRSIRPLRPEDVRQALALMASLPEWFTPTARRWLIADLNFHHGFIAESNSSLTGFVTYFSYEGVGQISWLAVDRAHHRKGIGKALVERTIEEFSRLGLEDADVRTLAESVEYEPYEKTRRFYAALGFKPFATVPGGKECPEAVILRMPISKTGNDVA